MMPHAEQVHTSRDATPGAPRGVGTGSPSVSVTVRSALPGRHVGPHARNAGFLPSLAMSRWTLVVSHGDTVGEEGAA